MSLSERGVYRLVFKLIIEITQKCIYFSISRSLTSQKQQLTLPKIENKLAAPWFKRKKTTRKLKFKVELATRYTKIKI